jgi:hypothetical protein
MHRDTSLDDRSGYSKTDNTNPGQVRDVTSEQAAAVIPLI